MHYEDFVLHLDATGDGKGVARVVSSPAGEAEGHFEVPCAASGDLPHLVRDTAEYFTRTRERRGGRKNGLRNVALEAGDDPPPPSLRLLGKCLFDAVFVGEVRSRLDQSLGYVRATPDTGLRLRIQTSVADAQAVRLHCLPWELLYRADEGAYLGLDPRTPIVRHLRVAQPPRRCPSPGTLRVLALSSSPDGLGALGLDAEQKDLADAWHTVQGVEVEPFDNAEICQLRDHVRAKDVAVLHFMGHGELPRSGSAGVLFFENARGEPVAVDGSVLADQLRDCTSLRLVFLNACESAAVATSGFGSGVATAFLEAGVPAVVAMQFPVSDDVALAFCRTVYRRLAAGQAIDEAVVEGRLAIRSQFPTSMEWATPVLFLRSLDGRVIEFQRPQPGLPPEPPAAAASHAKSSRSWMAGVAITGAMILVPMAGRFLPERQTPPGAAPADTTIQPAISTPPDSTTAEQTTGTGSAATLDQLPERPPPRDQKPAAPTSHTIADGESVYLAEIATDVTASFNTDFSTTYLELTLAPDGGNMMRKSMLKPETLVLEGSGKAVHVLGIDWNNRTVRVKARTPG